MVECFMRIFIFIIIIAKVGAQYRNDSSQYTQTMLANTEILKGEIQSHPDVNLYFYPERALISADSYVYDYPMSADYRIGLIVDPCRFNSYNCCLNVFGTPEYPALLQSGLESERVFKYAVIADEEEVSINYYLVYEDSSSVDTSDSRLADDESVLDKDCVTKGEPYSYCQGRNYAFQRSPLRPPCMDNNKSLNSLAGCFDPLNGTSLSKCVQIGYSSNTFIPQCGVNEDDHCGTYLEIHMAHGTPYQDESVVIAQTQITTRNVSGFYTTTLPLTWMNNQSKVLCSYAESTFRVGSLVYVKDTAPICCCPEPYQAATRIGSFQCPIGATGYGAFAYVSETLADTLTVDSLSLAYPYCPIDLGSTEDLMMCSAYDVRDRRHYSRNCTYVETQSRYTGSRIYGSTDMWGPYDGVCPYYPSCALTLDAGKCKRNDLRFTFVGRVGIITALDNTQVIPQAWVTFNKGRTSYQFSQVDLKLETNTKSNYEIWWVVRSKSEFTVQKRKGFNVTSPDCTFDTTNNRYFPYTILQNGEPLANSLVP